ncbi:acetoin dehydrogenase dihydrolipoyllysine-residue acetyltransferase subunit [Taklimakanibacter deserti]|uniref:acetoin dehydrogenase dihydrolipoyllysine-residue acetyltransferase subunit n=1 Tax=Taklimakanibacter deserti TaxID=2267839 RepID=UPI000E64C9EA
MTQALRHPIVIGSAGGEYMESVVVVDWAIEPGDPVKTGQTIVTVETAKAATEIAATQDGFLAEILHAAGSEVPVGSVLGYVSDRPEAAAPSRATADEPAPAPIEHVVASSPRAARPIVSPLARRLAAEAGLDLSQLKGSGPNGRIKKRDIEKLARPAILPASDSALPIVFLHGFAADRNIWRWVIPLLRLRNRVITPDLPRHGGALETPARSISDLAAAVATSLEGQGISDAHVVGHSLGGAAALALTGFGALRIHSLCLLAPAGLGPEINGGFLGGIAGAQTPESLAPWLEAMVGDPKVLPANFAQAVLRQRRQDNSAEAQLRLSADIFPNGTQQQDLAANLKALRIPAKIIWGKKDRIIPMAHAFKAPGTTALHLLDETGHVPHLECPDIVARLIDELILATGR